ncbi:hypothetical protein FDZ73_23930 [bacterium]|nr:MAG: hypothetical protein FDZ73_23930 [bacterium]
MGFNFHPTDSHWFGPAQRHIVDNVTGFGQFTGVASLIVARFIQFASGDHPGAYTAVWVVCIPVYERIMVCGEM